MQTNIIWEGREYFSLENCLVSESEKGADISSSIIGYYEGIIYKVDYHIKTNVSWETTFVQIHARHSNQIQTIILESDARGNWMADGKPAPAFQGCLDVDIPLTPFTNTLPIRRLELRNNEPEEIGMIYLDLLEKRISKVRQKYLRLSETQYHYENIPNDFEADIIVDNAGFIVDYPQLFIRKAAMQSHYP